MPIFTDTFLAHDLLFIFNNGSQFQPDRISSISGAVFFSNEKKKMNRAKISRKCTLEKKKARENFRETLSG